MDQKLKNKIVSDEQYIIKTSVSYNLVLTLMTRFGVRKLYSSFQFIKKYKLDIPSEYIDATIHCKEGGAVLMMERIYQLLTNRQ